MIPASSTTTFNNKARSTQIAKFTKLTSYGQGRVNSYSRIINTDEDPSLRIESFAILNLRGVSTKLNKYIVFIMQTYKETIKLR